VREKVSLGPVVVVVAAGIAVVIVIVTVVPTVSIVRPAVPVVALAAVTIWRIDLRSGALGQKQRGQRQHHYQVDYREWSCR
jgi:hypothetical protein